MPLPLLLLCSTAPHPSDYTHAASLIRSAASSVSDVWELGAACDICGPRMVGSIGLDCATTMWQATLSTFGLDAVYTTPVPGTATWRRCRADPTGGCERVALVSPRPARIHAVGIGGSPSTPGSAPVVAEALVVDSVDDIQRQCASVKGRILVANVNFTNYLTQSYLRGAVPMAAAACGAVAALLSSIGTGLQNPETGAGDAPSGLLPVPALAISREDSTLLHRLQHVHRRTPVVSVYTEGHRGPIVTARNLLAELHGADRPERFVVIGGHLDSWDNPGETGATDDGTGTWAAWSALKAINALVREGKLPRPKRSVRYVGWVDEERGGAGGKAYAAAHANETVFALESDSGNWQPYGNSFCGSGAAAEVMRGVVALNAPINASRLIYPAIGQDGCGADVAPLVAVDVPCASLEDVAFVNGTGFYFDYHHSAADTFTAVLDAEKEAKLSVAAIATIAYVLADLDQELPRSGARVSS